VIGVFSSDNTRNTCYFPLCCKNVIFTLSVYDSFSDPLGTFTFYSSDVWGSNPTPQKLFSYSDFERYPVWVLDTTAQTILVLMADISTLVQIQLPSGKINWNIPLTSNIWNDDFAGISIDVSSQKLYYLSCEIACTFAGPSNISVVEYAYNTSGANMLSTTKLGLFEPVNLLYSASLNSVLVIHNEGWTLFNTVTNEITTVLAGDQFCTDCTILKQ